jgi:hypothetical protein
LHAAISEVEPSWDRLFVADLEPLDITRMCTTYREPREREMDRAMHCEETC